LVKFATSVSVKVVLVAEGARLSWDGTGLNTAAGGKLHGSKRNV